MANVGYATLSIIPSFQGFRSQLERGAAVDMAAAGRTTGVRFGDEAGSSAGKRFGGRFSAALKSGGVLAGIAGAIGVAGLVKDAVELEATFGRTMSQIRVATAASSAELARLNQLAIDLGKETIFSANEASSAMLELAKNGIRPAAIEAGALKSALTLAAGGGVDLETAATTMGNALNAFELRARQSGQVAAALAGAANASSASVQSLAEGLQQSAATANDVGLSVQETTGILAAFANAGISGSDAGTSLKTTLSRLLPSTNKARKEMERFGISFTKSNGEFKSAAQIAEILQNSLGNLSDSERSAALDTIFGSDARRAATILMREGAEGINEYVRAASDQTQAEKMAAANMEGTAGAIERLSGAWETVKLQMGQFLAPLATDLLNGLSRALDALSGLSSFLDGPVGRAFRSFGGFLINDLGPALKSYLGDVVEGLSGAFSNFGDEISDNGPFLERMGDALAKVGQVLVDYVIPFFGEWAKVVLPAVGTAVGKLVDALQLVSVASLRMIEVGSVAFRGLFDAAVATFRGILEAAARGLGWLPGLGDKIKAANKAFRDFRNETVSKLDEIAANARALREELTAPAVLPVEIRYLSTAIPKNEGQLDRFGGARANGGPVDPSKYYLVGERGPELFAPSRSGQIIPNGAGGSGVTVERMTVVADDPWKWKRDMEHMNLAAAVGGADFRG